MNLTEFRSAFPAFADGVCFLDWAATGLLSDPARRAIHRYADELVSCPSGESTWMHGVHGKTRSEARSVAGRLLCARAADVALVESTTAGMNAIGLVLPVRPDENVVLMSIDYLAVATPWKTRAAREGFELRWVGHREGLVTADDILAACDARTRVVAVSTICWTTGALIDLDTLAPSLRERGIHLIVDGIQTFGVVPVDVMRTPAAAWCVGGHKWLASVLGAGLLYVDPEIAATHQPSVIGFLAGRPARGQWWEWFSDPDSSPREDIEFPPAGRTWETGGTPSYPGAIGLLESMTLLDAVGVPTILEHVRELGTRLIAGLDHRGLSVLTPGEPDRRAGIIVFRVSGGGDAQRAAAAALREAGVVVSVRFSDGVGGIRVSLHGPNDEADVDRLLAALD
ncbi:MAG: aminotransferase class V-fold PLP-dependent enzyme [Planctomycetes bacterium]|nr:aminotransferase class V-fold PLP-dependent enzyme [Planctomycetota bacterium]